jgi:choline transport protein
MSWLNGWITVLGWQTATASAAFLGGTMIQGLLVLNLPEYGFQRWHGTMIYWAILTISLIVNTIGIAVFPALEAVILVLHVVLFFAILIPLVVLAPHSTAEYVFTNFTNSSGWNSSGVAWSIGLLSATYVFVGYDGACHLSKYKQPRSGCCETNRTMRRRRNAQCSYSHALRHVKYHCY